MWTLVLDNLHRHSTETKFAALMLRFNFDASDKVVAAKED